MATNKDNKTINLGHGVGRRKTSVARVYLRDGNGQVKVNGKKLEEYFVDAINAAKVVQPFEVTETTGKYRHGLSRALVDYNADLRAALHAAGFMTRDPRMVERKKYGQKGARRRFQFSKR